MNNPTEVSNGWKAVNHEQAVRRLFSKPLSATNEWRLIGVLARLRELKYAEFTLATHAATIQHLNNQLDLMFEEVVE